ncbi:MAG TPA: hypothetical protein DD490_15300 [Acidobacteria bacterium]|nr:hypothetical protein [Acidobacteriota bacterium]
MQDLMMDVGPGFELANERCTCAQSAHTGEARPPRTGRGKPTKPADPGRSPRSPREGEARERPEDAPYEAAGAPPALAALRMQLQHNLAAGA